MQQSALSSVCMLLVLTNFSSVVWVSCEGRECFAQSNFFPDNKQAQTTAETERLKF
eukprot:m.163086 g.163086  ORF g.163086 m.163086 type:complete len:56 (+) comp14378_c0_seq20:4564-4731(+)